MKNIYKRFLALFAIFVMGMGTLLASGTKDDYLNSYLTVESLTDNDTITLRISKQLTAEQLNWVAYSTDGIEWTTIVIDTILQKDTIILNQGEKLHFKGFGKQCGVSINNYLGTFNIKGSDDHIVYGNVMSLLYGDDFVSQTTLPEESDYNFAYLFGENLHLVSAENLMLPATTLNNDSYYGLFFECSSLMLPPELPAINLSDGCYAYMFYGCTALTEAPALPANTLKDSCYIGMFFGCTSLIAAPEMRAITAADYCCYNMFRDCTSLTEAPVILATTLAYQCYFNMFMGCSSLVTAPELPATTMDDYCYCQMFYGCTSLTTAPALPATVLALACYEYMFSGCSSLTEAPELPATTLADECYTCMFFECTSLTSAPELPATSLASECYSFMFYHCTSLTETSELPATTMVFKCYKGMFDGCTSLTKTPILAAPILAFECYAGMFEGCSNLQEVTCLAIDISATDCVKWWLENVAPTGCFYKTPEMGDWPINSDSGIPEGWTVANYDAVDEQQNQVVAYPNPIKDKLHIIGTDIQSVKVFDMQGRLVHSEEYGHANQLDVDFQGYAKGVYTVSILNEGRNVTRTVTY